MRAHLHDVGNVQGLMDLPVNGPGLPVCRSGWPASMDSLMGDGMDYLGDQSFEIHPVAEHLVMVPVLYSGKRKDVFKINKIYKKALHLTHKIGWHKMLIKEIVVGAHILQVSVPTKPGLV